MQLLLAGRPRPAAVSPCHPSTSELGQGLELLRRLLGPPFPASPRPAFPWGCCVLHEPSLWDLEPHRLGALTQSSPSAPSLEGSSLWRRGVSRMVAVLTRRIAACGSRPRGAQDFLAPRRHARAEEPLGWLLCIRGLTLWDSRLLSWPPETGRG